MKVKNCTVPTPVYYNKSPNKIKIYLYSLNFMLRIKYLYETQTVQKSHCDVDFTEIVNFNKVLYLRESNVWNNENQNTFNIKKENKIWGRKSSKHDAYNVNICHYNVCVGRSYMWLNYYHNDKCGSINNNKTL